MPRRVLSEGQAWELTARRVVWQAVIDGMPRCRRYVKRYPLPQRRFEDRFPHLKIAYDDDEVGFANVIEARRFVRQHTSTRKLRLYEFLWRNPYVFFRLKSIFMQVDAASFDEIAEQPLRTRRRINYEAILQGRR